jgi:hypothetical protein
MCKTPTSYGFFTDLGTTEPHSPNILLGFKINVPVSTLTKFGMVVPATAAGAHAQFGLYRDGGSGPTTLVAQTNGVALTSGRNETSPTASSVALTAGDYWIMAGFDRETGVRHDMTTAATWRYVSFSYGTSLPATLGTTTPQSLVGNINFYILAY